MKAFSTMIVMGCLAAAAPLVQACNVNHHGGYGDRCLLEMDKNGDGVVSKKEFDAFHNEQFKKLDTNHDGKITQEEMDGPRKQMMEQGKDPFDTRFEEVDINHDAALSKDEAEIGMPMLFGHFDEIDANKDGKITKAEIVESMKKMHEHMHEKKDEGTQGGK